MDITLETLLAALLGYGCGSIPFGLLLTRMAGAGDVRRIGSGNIGATNVLRTGRKGLAAATLALDLLKGLVPVYLAWHFFWEDVGWTALFAVIGHSFPIWLGFRGGKGVATTGGVAFGIGWPLGLVYAGLWLGTLALVRISSVAGLTAVIGAAIFMWLTGAPSLAMAMTIIAVLVVFLHRANIARLMKGEEPKVGSKT